MGTPDFAVRSLDAIISDNYKISPFDLEILCNFSLSK